METQEKKKEIFLTQKQFDNRKNNGQLETGIVYHITDSVDIIFKNMFVSQAEFNDLKASDSLSSEIVYHIIDEPYNFDSVEEYSDEVFEELQTYETLQYQEKIYTKQTNVSSTILKYFHTGVETATEEVKIYSIVLNKTAKTLDIDEIPLNATYVSIDDVPTTATNGTLTETQLNTLLTNSNAYILFNNEKYYLMDEGHTEDYYTYTHIGYDNNIQWVKSITITVSTLAWVLNKQAISKYADDLKVYDEIIIDNVDIGKRSALTDKIEYTQHSLTKLAREFRTGESQDIYLKVKTKPISTRLIGLVNAGKVVMRFNYPLRNSSSRNKYGFANTFIRYYPTNVTFYKNFLVPITRDDIIADKNGNTIIVKVLPYSYFQLERLFLDTDGTIYADSFISREILDINGVENNDFTLLSIIKMFGGAIDKSNIGSIINYGTQDNIGNGVFANCKWLENYILSGHTKKHYVDSYYNSEYNLKYFDWNNSSAYRWIHKVGVTAYGLDSRAKDVSAGLYNNLFNSQAHKRLLIFGEDIFFEDVKNDTYDYWYKRLKFASKSNKKQTAKVNFAVVSDNYNNYGTEAYENTKPLFSEIYPIDDTLIISEYLFITEGHLKYTDLTEVYVTVKLIK